MKLFAIALLALSTSVIAATPATVAVNSLLPEGTYKGSNCTVSVSNSTDSVVVTVKTNSESASYGLSNKALGTNVDEQTGEVSASQSLNFPHYLQGGTKFLNIRALDNDTVAVSISKILLDHRGNDVSTYTECKVSL